MNNVSNVVSIAEYFKNNEPSKQVFDAIARSSSISGWSLAKSMQMDPERLQTYLDELRVRGLIQGDGPGLDAFFYLTELGFRFGSFVS